MYFPFSLPKQFDDLSFFNISVIKLNTFVVRYHSYKLSILILRWLNGSSIYLIPIFYHSWWGPLLLLVKFVRLIWPLSLTTYFIFILIFKEESHISKEKTWSGRFGWNIYVKRKFLSCNVEKQTVKTVQLVHTDHNFTKPVFFSYNSLKYTFG